MVEWNKSAFGGVESLNKILRQTEFCIANCIGMNINKTVKRFQMKSTGCRDVQHTGLQSTQTRRNYSSNNTGEQDAQTRGHLRIPKHPYISGCTACMSNNLAVFFQFVVTLNWLAYPTIIMHVKQPSIFSICCNLELISIFYNYHAATDVGMLGNSKMPPCLCILLTSVVARDTHIILEFLWE